MKVPDFTGPTNFITDLLTGIASFLTKIVSNPPLLIFLVVVVGGAYVYLKFFRQKE